MEELEHDKDESQEYILGYLALNHLTDPNDNIPILIVKEGADKDALRAPKDYQLIHEEKRKGKHPKTNKDVDIFRYWLKLIPHSDYIAMGSIVIEKYIKPIDENCIDQLSAYFDMDKHKALKRVHSLDKLRCIHKKYIMQFGQPLVEKLVTSKKSKFTLHRPQPAAISGIYKLVEMPCIIRKQVEFTEAPSSDNHVKMEHYSANINNKTMQKCVQLLQHNLRIVVDSPLIISYATHFKLVWSSKRITDTSNNRAAVWEPVLGPDEFMVGHIAYGDWNYPAKHNDNNKLLIVKAGGSDPDAIKEPLGFECVWSVYQPGKDHKFGKQKSIGGGLLLSTVAGKTGIIDNEMPSSGSFWKAIPPQGYTALGDIALSIDGQISGDNDDGTKRKLTINQLLRSHDVPKYVCIKNEYLSQFRKLDINESVLKTEKNIFENAKGNLQKSMLENKVRNRIWSSERNKDLLHHAGIYEQEPVTRDILSPIFCKSGKDTPFAKDLYPTLDIESVIEAQPYWNVIKTGILKKTGQGIVARSHKRYFVLTNEKLMYYYDEIELKGTIDLKIMVKASQCAISGSSEKIFYIDTPERKWELEVVDEDSTASEWVQSIRYVFNRKHIGGADEEDIDDEMSMNSHSRGAIIEEKESEQQKIVKLIDKMLKHFVELLKNTKKENETQETVQNAVKWYEDLEHTQQAIDILLAKWPRGTVCPPGVVRARAQLKDLMEQSEIVILDDIKAYANENNSPFTILRLHRACTLMSDLPKGQMMVSQYVTEILLKNAQNVFVAGNKDSDLKHIDRRFNEYRRQMKDYDKRYRQFIPKWWNLPIQIASRFCSIMGESLDDQLTRFPESHDSISEAKKKCSLFEQELIEDAMRRMAAVEVDVRSWGRFDKGQNESYIKIDDQDVMIKGYGLCVIVLDLFTKKILKKKLFKFCDHSAFRSPMRHKPLLKEWLIFLDDISDQHLIIMASHNRGGQQEFKKQLNIDGLPKELKNLSITEQDMFNETNLFAQFGSFIYIGRKGRKDKYFTCIQKGGREGPIMARQIISPYIPKNRLTKLVDTDSIPFYEGIISQVLERHLDIFVGEEAKNVQLILANVRNQETIIKLEENKNWLSTINKMSVSQKSAAHLDSVLKIQKTMKKSIEECMKISNGKPLLELLRKYAQILQEYATILLRLLNEAGGKKLTQKLFTKDNKSVQNETLLAKLKGNQNGDDDEKKMKDEDIVNKSIRGLSAFKNNISQITHASANSPFSIEQIQWFIIYCCMIYNTCGKARDLLTELIKIGRQQIQKKYKNAAKSELCETRDLYLSIEEQCLQLIRAAVMDRVEVLFKFEKHQDWTLENYKKELNLISDTYLNNPSKLLTPSALQQFYKVFVAHFALKLFNRIINSNTLNAANSNQNSSVLVDLPPLFESIVLKKIPERIIKKMKIYINRCLNPVIKLIQMALANAGDKYTKLEPVKSEKDKNLFSKFFGGGKKSKTNNNNGDDNNNIDISTQMRLRQKTEIANTQFAYKAVEFYTNTAISLQILNNVPSYKEMFAEDDDDILATHDGAAVAVANVIDASINALDDVRKDIESQQQQEQKNNDENNNNNNHNNIGSPTDSDYFGSETIKVRQTRSSSGFAVKKVVKEKKKKKRPPMAAPPSVPTSATPKIAKKPPMTAPPSAPIFQHNKTEQKPAQGLGIGLNAMSLIMKTELKHQAKWKCIEKVMALREFDVADQQTIRILCEDAQNNIQASR